MSDQSPHSFSTKDPHLLKPPTVLNAAGGFGRRASDGGANLHMYWSCPGSKEHLASAGASGGVPGATQRTNTNAGTSQLEHTQQGLEELADPFAVARYFKL